MLSSDKTVHGVISREDAARAIYVDFEGFKDKSPCLIGILVEGTLEQVVLDRRLFAAAVASRCRKGVVRVDNTLKSYLEAIGYPMPASLGTGIAAWGLDTARLQRRTPAFVS